MIDCDECGMPIGDLIQPMFPTDDDDIVCQCCFTLRYGRPPTFVDAEFVPLVKRSTITAYCQRMLRWSPTAEVRVLPRSRD